MMTVKEMYFETQDSIIGDVRFKTEEEREAKMKELSAKGYKIISYDDDNGNLVKLADYTI